MTYKELLKNLEDSKNFTSEQKELIKSYMDLSKAIGESEELQRQLKNQNV